MPPANTLLKKVVQDQCISFERVNVIRGMCKVVRVTLKALYSIELYTKDAFPLLNERIFNPE
jgi:hypothetical protein